MKLGVGVVGLGIGEQHARGFAKHPNCQLTWLYDLLEDKAVSLAQGLGQGMAAHSFDQLLSDPKTDIISIASFDHLHFEQVCLALDAGKHVFVEKPLCRGREELAGIRRRWEKANKPYLMSNLVLRGAPFYQWLLDMARSGDLGDIFAFDGDYLYGRLEKLTEGWRKDVPDYSVLEGGGIHLMDVMLDLVNSTPTRITTFGNKVVTRDTAFPFDDFMTATVEFSSGTIGRLTANFGCQHPHHHVLRVFGTKATVLYDDQGPRWFRSRKDGAEAEKLDLVALPDSKQVLIPSFVDAILSKANPTALAEREFRLIEVISDAELSATNPATP